PKNQMTPSSGKPVSLSTAGTKINQLGRYSRCRDTVVRPGMPHRHLLQAARENTAAALCNPRLPLALLMPRFLANYPHNPFTANDFAISANAFHGRPNFHYCLLKTNFLLSKAHFRE